MSKKPRSIDEFMRDARKADCAVCKLPIEIRKQMVDARRRGIVVGVVIEWLKGEWGVAITREQWRTHQGGMHDGKDFVVGR